MTLREYYKELARYIKDNPEMIDLDIKYSIDDEGNDYKNIHYSPTKLKIENKTFTCIN